MLTFFHGWRRQIECVSLVIACVLMAGWVRSHFLVDNINIPRPTVLHAISSGWGAINWTRISPHPIVLEKAFAQAKH